MNKKFADTFNVAERRARSAETELLGVRVRVDLAERLRARAQQDKVTQREIVEAALVEWFKTREL